MAIIQTYLTIRLHLIETKFFSRSSEIVETTTTPCPTKAQHKCPGKLSRKDNYMSAICGRGQTLTHRILLLSYRGDRLLYLV